MVYNALQLVFFVRLFNTQKHSFKILGCFKKKTEPGSFAVCWQKKTCIFANYVFFKHFDDEIHKEVQNAALTDTVEEILQSMFYDIVFNYNLDSVTLRFMVFFFRVVHAL